MAHPAEQENVPQQLHRIGQGKFFLLAHAGNFNLTKQRQVCQPYRRSCSAGRLQGGVDKYTAHTSQHVHGHARTHTRTHTCTLGGSREPQRAYVWVRVRVRVCTLRVRAHADECVLCWSTSTLNCSRSLSHALSLTASLPLSAFVFCSSTCWKPQLDKTKTSVSTIPETLFGWTSFFFRWRG